MTQLVKELEQIISDVVDHPLRKYGCEVEFDISYSMYQAMPSIAAKVSVCWHPGIMERLYADLSKWHPASLNLEKTEVVSVISNANEIDKISLIFTWRK